MFDIKTARDTIEPSPCVQTILKITVSTIIILLTVLVCYRYIYIKTRTSVDFSEILKNEKIEDLTLTIYCCDPRFISSYNYSSAEELIMAEKYNDVCKFVVQGETLKEYINTFKQINKANIKPMRKLKRKPPVQYRLEQAA